ncbi:Ig-like domain-containing protein [Priestia megaterium]
MNKKGIVSLLSVGLLASSLFVSTVQAEGNHYEISKKAIEKHLKINKSLKNNVINPSVINDIKEETLNSIKIPQTYSSKGFSKSGISSNSSDPMFEQEPNDDFNIADTLLDDRMTIGQLPTNYDLDFYKVSVEGKGVLYVGGVTDVPSNIELAFIATEKDFEEHGYLEYLGSDFNEGTEVQAYQVNKAGTYYIPVLDEDDLDNNEDEIYGIVTKFELDVPAKDTVAPSNPTVNKVDNNDKTVTGKAEANSTVTINVGKQRIGYAKASSNGSFSVSIPVQKAGITLNATAKDSAGNVSKPTYITVADVIPPSNPTVNRVDNNDKVVTGKTEANSTVTVKAGTKALGSAKTSSKGTYSVSIPVQKAGTVLSVNARDVAGNASSNTTIKVADVVAPSKPTVNKVDDNDKLVTGKTEDNSTVTVNVGKNRIGYAKANSKGVYSVSIPVQKKGTTLNVTAKDNSGNVSSPTYITVVKH